MTDIKSQQILILTDLHWTDASRKINSKDILSLKSKNVIPEKEQFLKVKEYVEIIKKHNPTIILFGGDITGDGSCGHGYHFAFFYLLQYLEHHKIKSAFIKGNHDIDLYYNKLLKNTAKLKYTTEISGKSASINGLQILGLSFEDTKIKTRLINQIKKNEKYDIILSHSELTRRPWLFDFDTKYIITGHYDFKFNSINNKIFLSFFNDYPSRNYATINFGNNKELISYYLKPGYTTNGPPAPEILVQGQKINDAFSFLKINDKNSNHFYRKQYYNDILGIEFKAGFEQILNSKKDFKSSSVKLSKVQINNIVVLKVNSFLKISKTLILDYFGAAGVEK